MSKNNVFANLARVVQKEVPETKTKDTVQVKQADSQSVKQLNRQTASQPKVVKKVSQQPLGKNKHPDYKLASFYIKNDTHLAFKKAILDKDNDMSDVIEKLITEWLKKQN
jgi:hypothetical protein